MKSPTVILFLFSMFATPLAGQTNQDLNLTVDPAFSSMDSVSRHQALQTGNAASWYFRSIIELEEISKAYLESWSKWAELPLSSFPAAEVHAAFQGAEPVISALHNGSSSNYCDWVVPGPASTQYCPELSKLRLIATAINLSSAKSQFLRGDTTKAYKSIGANLSLASHLTKGPTATHVLTGVYIANATVDLLFEFSQFTGAGNQYWEIAFFCKDFSSNIIVLEEEGHFVQQLFPNLADVGDRPFNRLDFETLEKHGAKIRAEFDAEDLALPNWRHLSIEEIGTGSKKRLLKSGYSSEFIDSLENFQLLLLDITTRRRRFLLECEAWLRLPLHASLQNLKGSHQHYYEAVTELDALLTGGALIRTDCIADLPELLSRALQCEQKIAMLSNIASLRHFVANSEGRMPQSENVMLELPLMMDPSTGKHFSVRPIDANSVQIKSQSKQKRFRLDCLVSFRVSNRNRSNKPTKSNATDKD